MDYKKQIGKRRVAVLLFIAIMLPVTTQFFHLFEAHEHTVCTDNTTHFHETIIKCEICSFHFTPINYDIAQYPDLLLPKIAVKKEVNFTSLQLHSFCVTNTQLRAPPVFS